MNGLITCKVNELLTTEEFIEVLKASTLAERRPINDLKCMERMVKNSNLTVSAIYGDKLIGIARSVTDFHYCCYLSDIAVDAEYQNKGIGKKLIRITRQQLGKHCKLILLSAPSVIDYYPKLGFKKHPQTWYLDNEEEK
ncbi:MAG: GNAT family N-acetyltransferase [Ignavibacteria bacterium]|nr:GNAT family N-acetyltransferase [Ignavibacteria bacterium]